MTKPHKRWKSFIRRRVVIVLQNEDSSLDLVHGHMKVRVANAEFNKNVYEGPVQLLHQNLPLHLRRKTLAGVLVADNTRDFMGRIDWVQEMGVVPEDILERALEGLTVPA